jgi:hypothetical protein
MDGVIGAPDKLMPKRRLAGPVDARHLQRVAPKKRGASGTAIIAVREVAFAFLVNQTFRKPQD